MNLHMLQPNSKNKTFHAVTRSKAKMYEYAVPVEQHINTGEVALSEMLDLTIGMLGEITSGTLSDPEEEKYRLLFSAQYFNSILEAETISCDQVLLRLLAASSYYLSGYPGSSSVLLKNITSDQVDVLTEMEQILFAVLSRTSISNIMEGTPFFEDINNLINSWNAFLETEESRSELEERSSILRLKIYQSGTDKDLLLIDVVKTLILKRFDVSVKAVLTTHSDVRAELWEPYFLKPNHIEEFWPSQIKLAEYGVFRGVSAVIQMPTSAGKTKATEFIIRSSFLSNRSRLAIIVAPFRALCQEIYNDFEKNFSGDLDINVSLVSDVLQEDFTFDEEIQKSVLILTPEKLDFMLRHDSSLSESIGLIIYDEGHLFDDESRGSKYELLLSHLKQQLAEDTQVVLISAVITNAQEVKDWLMSHESVLVDGKDLSPTNRSLAFVDWTQRNGFIRFVDEHDINHGLFFVPSILKSYEIDRRPRERQKFFPKPKPRGQGYESSQIAGLLGSRLASSGLSAIFVGQKKSAQKIAKDLIDAYARNIPIEKPSLFSENADQANKIIAYIEKVLGATNINATASKLGILLHHTGIPHGLRLVTEHALGKSYFKVVICTSTLAQGVNLPIRYLIVSTSHQAGERIKTRDFHNLMGRAGRSGKYTEGTVIFTNPRIYRARTLRGRTWTDVQHLLNSDNSEPSVSRMHVLLEERPEDEEDIASWENQVASTRKEITSYLLNALANVTDAREMETTVTNLVQNTLGYSQLETGEQKTILTGIFLEIGMSIINQVPEASQRVVYGRYILTLQQSQDFVNVMQANLDSIILSLEFGDIMSPLDMLWEYLYLYSNSKVLKSFTQEDALILCKQWINGESFLSILNSASPLTRTARQRLEMMNIVDLCESGFSYDIATLLGSLYELMTIFFPDEYLDLIKSECYLMQKRLKYGTPGELESIIYELGFSDRGLSMEISALLETPLVTSSRNEVARAIRNNAAVREIIENEYPEYFLTRLSSLSTR